MNARSLPLAAWLGVFVTLSSPPASAAFEWQEASPAARGMSGEKLTAMREALEKAGTTGLLVVRRDRVVLEWYADGWDAKKPHGTASLAKSLIGGVSLAVAMQDGRIRPDDSASQFVAQW